METHRDHLELGTEPASVLLSDLRRAAVSGFSLASDPTAHVVDGSRLVYAVSPDTGERRLVAVLSASTAFGPGVAQKVAKADRERAHLVRWNMIVTQDELAERMNVVTSTIQNWRKLPSFPRPLRRMGPVLIWDLEEVQRWARERERYRNKKTGAMPPGR